ncbi:flagellar basal-body rod protein FlgF [Fusobacterium sp. CAG:439]|nr:flagellar basal-body rod protein FlgF [Fusobacterium sp. CAG:439]
MIINGGIRYCEKGLTTSLRAMHVQSELIGMYNENVTGFDKIGFQRKDPVVSSFTEYIGVHGLSQTIDDKVGRIAMSDNPLDLALANKGYFQVQSAEGIKLTRDGRFKLDKEGNLLTLEDASVLSSAGVPIKLPVVPEKIEDVKINSKGLVSVFNKNTNKLEGVAFLGVVDANGVVVMDPQVKQGYNEYSNVALQNEFISMMPIIRNFEANRQIFMIQNQNLQKVISQLGTTS